MTELGPDDGLRIVDAEADDVDDDETAERHGNGDADLETLRDAFVDAFNARDLEHLTSLAAPDVECPDVGDGVTALSEALESIWERAPAAILTRAFLDDEPAAVGWLPDEDGCWSRAAVVCFATDDGLLSVIALPDDADALDRVEAEEPTGEELDEWTDWAEWERGEETVPRPRP